MKESRVFELNQVTAEQVLEAVTTFLRGEKGMEVQSVATPNGYLIQAAQAAGLSVPEDFSVTGYDNDPVCNDIFPWLTTLSQDFFRIGQVAATLMHCQLHGMPIGPVSIIPPLLVRSSTAEVKS